jgi:hypothetical protein
MVVAFRLLPPAWQFEHWSQLARNVATASFAVVVLVDTGLIAWNIAFSSAKPRRAG